jgi:glycosyltransferase involved in cell wall biosynthesis
MTNTPAMVSMTRRADVSEVRTGKTLVTVVLPAHNEESTLPLVVPAVVAATTPCDVEILIVDDGSTDETWRQIQLLRKIHPGVRGFRFTRNFGHQAAILAGLLHARGDAVIVMDADGQHPPALIPVFLEQWRQGHQVVQAIRTADPGRPIKSWFSRQFYRLLHALSGVDVPAGAADFRLLGRPVVDEVLKSAGHLLFLRGLVPYLGYEAALVPFVAPPRLAGRTSYTWRKMVRLSLDGLMSFSIIPLRAAIVIGFSVSIASFLYLVYIVAIWLTASGVVPGWASTVGLLSLLGGIQLLTLGVVGEYLGRLFLYSLNRPSFVIREQTGSVQERVPAAAP